MGRPRTFDHDEAKRLHAAGLTYAQIGRRLGATLPAVKGAVRGYPEEERRRRAVRAREKYRAPCKGGCGRMVWAIGERRTGYCRSCSSHARSRTVRPDALLCPRCGEWKPDEEFHADRKAVMRRGRGIYCRPCATADRGERRERAKVPCVNCGRLRLRESKTGLCRKCVLKRAEPLLLGPPE